MMKAISSKRIEELRKAAEAYQQSLDDEDPDTVDEMCAAYSELVERPETLILPLLMHIRRLEADAESERDT